MKLNKSRHFVEFYLNIVSDIAGFEYLTMADKKRDNFKKGLGAIYGIITDMPNDETTTINTTKHICC